MLGGISDPKNPRSCKKHASIHCGKKILISEDISNFYPNTSYEAVKGIWKQCFHFTDNISEVLALLTTFNGELPQGWKTSGYLANLALWKHEPKLVKTLEDNGFSYSRFIDDITVSSPYFITSETKHFIVSNIYRMLLPSGYSPKRTKHDISSRESPMEVTSLNVNTKYPTIPKRQRNNIRAMVFQLERLALSQRRTHSYYKQWLSLYGKVNRIKSFHEREGEDLQRRMRLIKPNKNFFRK
ncbi:reverse transcriptase family protein [Hahella ganghwensis]|uniref:reverse transcriptase family protein n=1 Tax=Hahella ganghwensis TaxID=286420 RepID=UPI000364CA8F|nr:reverse transcriptase family protein [Hahella ganghwensis]